MSFKSKHKKPFSKNASLNTKKGMLHTTRLITKDHEAFKVYFHPDGTKKTAEEVLQQEKEKIGENLKEKIQ